MRLPLGRRKVSHGPWFKEIGRNHQPTARASVRFNFKSWQDSHPSRRSTEQQEKQEQSQSKIIL